MVRQCARRTSQRHRRRSISCRSRGHAPLLARRKRQLHERILDFVLSDGALLVQVEVVETATEGGHRVRILRRKLDLATRPTAAPAGHCECSRSGGCRRGSGTTQAPLPDSTSSSTSRGGERPQTAKRTHGGRDVSAVRALGMRMRAPMRGANARLNADCTQNARACQPDPPPHPSQKACPSTFSKFQLELSGRGWISTGAVDVGRRALNDGFVVRGGRGASSASSFERRRSWGGRPPKNRPASRRA